MKVTFQTSVSPFARMILASAILQNVSKSMSWHRFDRMLMRISASGASVVVVVVVIVDMVGSLSDYLTRLPSVTQTATIIPNAKNPDTIMARLTASALVV